MLPNPIPPQIQLEKTYNAAADHYDHPALSFWDRFARHTVERMSLIFGSGTKPTGGMLRGSVPQS